MGAGAADALSYRRPSLPPPCPCLSPSHRRPTAPRKARKVLGGGAKCYVAVKMRRYARSALRPRMNPRARPVRRRTREHENGNSHDSHMAALASSERPAPTAVRERPRECAYT